MNDNTIGWQGKDVEQLELAYIIGGCTELIDHWGKKLAVFFLKSN